MYCKSEILRNVCRSLLKVIENYQRAFVLLLDYAADGIEHLRKLNQKAFDRIYIVLCLSAISFIGCTDVLSFQTNVKFPTINWIIFKQKMSAS